VEAFINSKEEKWMEIPEERIKGWRKEHKVPSTDGIEEIIE
jgi:hypothetical protein